MIKDFRSLGDFGSLPVPEQRRFLWAGILDDNRVIAENVNVVVATETSIDENGAGRSESRVDHRP